MEDSFLFTHKYNRKFHMKPIKYQINMKLYKFSFNNNAIIV